MTYRRPFGRPAGGAAADPSGPRGEVLFEFVTRGNATRCAAIDAATGVEVVVVGPPAAGEAHLKTVALRKLRMRLAQK